MKQPQIAYGLLGAQKKLRVVGIELLAPEVDIDDCIIYRTSPDGHYVMVAEDSIQLIVVGNRMLVSFYENLFPRYKLDRTEVMFFDKTVKEEDMVPGRFFSYIYKPTREGAR